MRIGSFSPYYLKVTLKVTLLFFNKYEDSYYISKLFSFYFEVNLKVTLLLISKYELFTEKKKVSPFLGLCMVLLLLLVMVFKL